MHNTPIHIRKNTHPHAHSHSLPEDLHRQTHAQRQHVGRAFAAMASGLADLRTKYDLALTDTHEGIEQEMMERLQVRVWLGG